MVQPQPDGPMQWDMPAEEIGGTLRVPPELASNEVVTRLLGDNQQLREALQRSNLALRQRCEEMEGWQQRTRGEREFLSCRFQEARALVERLAQENHSLQSLVNGSAPSSAHCCSSSQTEELQARQARSRPLDGPQTLDQREKKRVEETDQNTQTMPPRSLGNASVHSSLSSALPSPSSSLSEVWGEKVGMKDGQAVSVSDEAAQHRSEAQHSSDCSSLAKLTEQLQATQGSGSQPGDESVVSAGTVIWRRSWITCRRVSAQRDRTEALLKQKDKDCAQVRTVNSSPAAKVTDGELNERQSCLEKSEHERKMLDEKLCSKMKALQGGDLCSRLEEAERALALKQDLIDKLKEEVEQQRGSLETVPVLTAQAEIYKADFLAEREAREKLNQKKEELQDQLTQALTEIDRLKQEATSLRARIEQMKLRHLEDFPTRGHTHSPPSSGFQAGMSGTTPPPPSAEALGTEACFFPGYKPFKPEEHGLERGFRLTAFSDLKG
ncbi:hypothetical protein KUCAC02_012968 [Chaenocephalus aceratus]|uniref:Uncharacterized protein n=1 Tax=Chaenocephalus aceratus TaxID=36190 RepID=A0ACB9XD53_CHAAC|nr:hypothetical protein KUCAC02_012968 [Chaenocephalus aceratus]